MFSNCLEIEDQPFKKHVGGGTLKVVQPMASKLHCKVGVLPFLYLGLPVGAHPKYNRTWNPVVENFERKLLI